MSEPDFSPASLYEEPHTVPTHVCPDHAGERPRRPRLVWVIAIGYGAAAVFMLAGVVSYLLGTPARTTEGTRYLASLTGVDVTMTVLLAGLQLAAVVALFQLRAVAAKLFLANLLIGLAEQLRLASSPSWRDYVLTSPTLLLGSLGSVAILCFLVYYSERLRQGGVLR